VPELVAGDTIHEQLKHLSIVVKRQLYSAYISNESDVHDAMYSQSITMTHPVGVADSQCAASTQYNDCVVSHQTSDSRSSQESFKRVYSSDR
jgi:hypothetical protein